MEKITPFLWFNGQAEEAARFYTRVFADAEMGMVVRSGPGPDAPAFTVTFRLFGQQFIALNGGPQTPFSPAVSFVVNCDTQEEIDRFWNQLTEGGTIQQCGWLQDRYGLSWQVVPRALGGMMQGGDAQRTARVMQAMMGMQKLNLAVLQQAFDAPAEA